MTSDITALFKYLFRVTTSRNLKRTSYEKRDDIKTLSTLNQVEKTFS